VPGLLTAGPTDDQRRRNDVHRPAVVFAVLVALAALAWLFTDVAARLGLPTARDVLGVLPLDVAYRRDGSVDTSLAMSFAGGS